MKKKNMEYKTKSINDADYFEQPKTVSRILQILFLLIVISSLWAAFDWVVVQEDTVYFIKNKATKTVHTNVKDKFLLFKLVYKIEKVIHKKAIIESEVKIISGGTTTFIKNNITIEIVDSDEILLEVYKKYPRIDTLILNIVITYMEQYYTTYYFNSDIGKNLHSFCEVTAMKIIPMNIKKQYNLSVKVNVVSFIGETKQDNSKSNISRSSDSPP